MSYCKKRHPAVIGAGEEAARVISAGLTDASEKESKSALLAGRTLFMFY
jgi:hypothetical protein